VQYSCDAVDPSVAELQQTLSKQLCDKAVRHCTLISVGNRTLLAFVAKEDTSKINSKDIELPGCKVDAVSTPGNRSRRPQIAAQSLRCFNDCAVDCASDLWLDPAPDGVTWTLEQIYKVTEKLDEEALIALTAEVKMIPLDKRDTFQQQFWKVRAELRQLRAIRKAKTGSPLAITLANKASHLQPLREFTVDLLRCPIVVHDTSLWPSGRCTVAEYFGNEALHLNLTLLIHGPTGQGKTEVAKTLGFATSAQYHASPCLWFANTVDSLRTVQSQILPGHVVLFDELDPASIQLVHADSNFLKADFHTS
jgi:hypothetical protein